MTPLCDANQHDIEPVTTDTFFRIYFLFYFVLSLFVFFFPSEAKTRVYSLAQQETFSIGHDYCVWPPRFMLSGLPRGNPKRLIPIIQYNG